MKTPLRDNTTVAIQIVRKIRGMISDVFNKQFFGVYEAVIEQIDTRNGRADIRIIDLDDLAINNVRIIFPLINSSAIISTPVAIGTHVLVAFRAFKLSKPVIIGQIPDESEPQVLRQDLIRIKNGSSSIELWSDGTITITGTAITANGEDLTTDEKGLL